MVLIVGWMCVPGKYQQGQTGGVFNFFHNEEASFTLPVQRLLPDRSCQENQISVSVVSKRMFEKASYCVAMTIFRTAYQIYILSSIVGLPLE